MDTDISTDEFQKKLEEDRGVVIDVRTKKEFDEGHLAQTDFQFDFLNGEFSDQIESLDKDKTYYLYCRTGNRSGNAARIMQKEGFKKVYNIGGFEDLENAGFDTKK